MTQQYLVGQFSALLGDLEGPAADWRRAVHRLRRDVERSHPRGLVPLADEVLRLSDTICWGRLEQGDGEGFCRCVEAAAALAEFIEAAGLPLQ
jgi:hypothetical protein